MHDGPVKIIIPSSFSETLEGSKAVQLPIDTWRRIKHEMHNCDSAKSMAYKVQNKMQKYFVADTKSSLVADWFDIFIYTVHNVSWCRSIMSNYKIKNNALYLNFDVVFFGSWFDTDIIFRIFISYYTLPISHIRSLTLRILYVPVICWLKNAKCDGLETTAKQPNTQSSNRSRSKSQSGICHINN